MSAQKYFGATAHRVKLLLALFACVSLPCLGFVPVRCLPLRVLGPHPGWRISNTPRSFGHASSLTNVAAATVQSTVGAGATIGKSRGLLQAFAAFLGTVINPVGGAVAGGLLSGGLHAITGPDHLAAILPPSVGQRGWVGVRIGATWGLGHGVSAIFLGICAYFLKGRMSSKFRFLQQLSTLAESAVGVSLLFIGVMGIKENLESDNLVDGHGDGDGTDLQLSGVKTSKAIFANGVLHGFSWDGAPSLAPALAMTSWHSALSFLLAYCFGTMAAMSLTAGVVGEGSVRLGKAVNSPALPKQLSLGSSFIAIIIGAYWLFLAISGASR